MTIATLDAALAGMQAPRMFGKAVTGTPVIGRPLSLWNLAGSPGPGSFDNTLNGVILSSSSAQVNGQIPHTDPAGAAYLARFSAMNTQGGLLMLCDRLWHNQIANATGAQNITQPTLPARDAAGATLGDGVLAALEFSVASSAGTNTATLAYTNQAGGTARAAVNYDLATATTAVGSFLRIGLQAGDTGIRSIQSVTLSGTFTGPTLNLVLYRPLALLELTGNMPNAIDALTAGFPRLYNGVVPFLVWIPPTTTASIHSGSYVESQG